MNKKVNVFVVGSQKDYSSWIVNARNTDDIEKADIVLFTGGEDVHPVLYNEPRGRYTASNIHRDTTEKAVFNRCLELNKPMLGICRGSQLMCALSGGRLIQHQENPYSVHDIITSDGVVVPITSSHHQAQYPYDMPTAHYKILAWTEGISKIHLDGNNAEISLDRFKEVEVAYYPITNALAIQGHPEWMRRESNKETFEYLDSLIDKLLKNKL